MGRYEHHSEKIYTSRTLAAVADRSIPARVKPLWAVLVRLSKNGTRAIFARSSWLAEQAGITRSTYYEHRAILVAAEVIEVEENRASYDRSAASTVRVLSTRSLFALVKSERWRLRLEAWKRARAEKAARRKALKSGCPGDRTQKGNIYDISSNMTALPTLKAVPPAWEKRRELLSALERTLALDRLGVSEAVLAAIPDADHA